MTRRAFPDGATRAAMATFLRAGYEYLADVQTLIGSGPWTYRTDGVMVEAWVPAQADDSEPAGANRLSFICYMDNLASVSWFIDTEVKGSGLIPHAIVDAVTDSGDWFSDRWEVSVARISVPTRCAFVERIPRLHRLAT